MELGRVERAFKLWRTTARYSFLGDGLESVETGEVVLKLISPLRPGLIESADGSGFLYLIMPIRLNV